MQVQQERDAAKAAKAKAEAEAEANGTLSWASRGFAALVSMFRSSAGDGEGESDGKASGAIRRRFRWKPSNGGMKKNTEGEWSLPTETGGKRGKKSGHKTRSKTKAELSWRTNDSPLVAPCEEVVEAEAGGLPASGMVYVPGQPKSSQAQRPCGDATAGDGNQVEGQCCIRPPDDRAVPRELCPTKDTRVLLLSFFTVPNATKLGSWTTNDHTLGVRNRLCYAARRRYKYIVEVIDPDGFEGPIMFTKVYLVQKYLRQTDWLVWLDHDLIVKNPLNWFEAYLRPEFDLYVTDHMQDINNGAFVLKNSVWGRAFVEEWMGIVHESAFKVYPFTDNGPFAETVLRMGTRDMGAARRYSPGFCLAEMLRTGVGPSAKKTYPMRWTQCLEYVKLSVVAPFERLAHRDLGRIRFVATAEGFNSHVWESWKEVNGRTGDTFFHEGMFMLHNKDFERNVPASSTTCAQSKAIPQDVLERAFSTQGSYMLSETGLCDLDTTACRREHFAQACTAEELGELGTPGIISRLEALKKDRETSTQVYNAKMEEIDTGEKKGKMAMRTKRSRRNRGPSKRAPRGA